MPGTPEEAVEVACQILDGELAAEALDTVRWADGTGLNDDERSLIPWCVRVVRSMRRSRKLRRAKAQRKAMQLLRRHLSTEQLCELRRNRYFTITSASGRRYRFFPARGRTEGMERHGTRFYAHCWFCLHDEEHRMPPADLTLAHLLWISCDEATFLTTANAHSRHLWSRVQ